MKDLALKVITNKEIAPKTYEMVFAAEGATHGITNPGQFINIKLDGFFLRRPISICDWTDDEITIIYKAVGHGTESMSSYKHGKTVDVLLPLGNGYNIEGTGKKPLLIGGGAGVPPMYGLCRKLTEAGKTPDVVLGFNNVDEIFYKEKFEALGAHVIVTTADGSEGVKGFVTDGIKALKRNYSDEHNQFCTDFYACGPEVMLKALDDAIPDEIPGFMSFEERMGCGFGACMGCSCETKYGNIRICKDGPVLERREIIW